MNTAARAAFCGLELRHGRADLLRAVFEGVAFSVLDAAVTLPEFADAPEVYLAGGGTLHHKWRQLLCDLLGKVLLVVEDPNASARGAAVLGGRAVGMAEDDGQKTPLVGRIEPRPYAHEALMMAFDRWKSDGG
jgi:xylulokinase